MREHGHASGFQLYVKTNKESPSDSLAVFISEFKTNVRWILSARVCMPACVSMYVFHRWMEECFNRQSRKIKFYRK